MYGIDDPRLIEEPMPYYATPIWNTFWVLHTSRQMQQGGSYQPILFSEIASYAQLMQIRFDPWEVELLKRMDVAYLNSINIRVGDK